MKFNNEKGQSTIEFVLTFGFAISFIVLFIYLALNMTTGFVLHYATFMSSRTFLSYDSSSNSSEAVISQAEEMAQKTFNSYQLHRLKIKTSDFKVNKPGQINNALFVGVHARFKKPVSPLKNIGGGIEATYLSESFLGKEPMRIECYEEICNAMGLGGCSKAYDVTLFDNGC
jgi:hypothetical protein